MSAEFDEVPGLKYGKKYRVIDVWTGAIRGTFRYRIELPVRTNDTAAFLIQEL